MGEEATMRMARRWGAWTVGVALAGLAAGGAVAEAGHEDGKVLLFAQPIAKADAIWMALKKGFFKEEKLDVTVKWFSAGTTAMQTFQAGKDGKRGFGDFNTGGELPAVNFWQNMDEQFTLFAVIERDTEGYVGVAKAEIKAGKDLKGKTIATRVGSTGSWFISEYLKAHGLNERDVTIKNMDPHIMPSALDRGDIDAFFIWEPYGAQALKISGSRVHRLTTAKGYLNGYLVIGTWKWYLRDHPGVAERMLKAIDKGRRYAAENKAEVIEYARTEFSLQDTAPVEADYSYNERVVGLDKVAWDDFQKLARWMKEAGMAKRDFNPKSFFDPRPLRAALPDRVSPEFRW
jgi:ABC-type nitrate/sulfonate/bicarbonate transport system substrate-binding protein